MVPLFCC